MLRLVLLLLYLLAWSSTMPQTDQGGGADPLGINAPSASDGGGSADPLGFPGSPPSDTPTSDAGGGYDPNGVK